MKLRKWNNIIHRDLGYFLFGLTVIYAISGFMLNHKGDWNPSYSITRTLVDFKPIAGLSKDVKISKDEVLDILKSIRIDGNYKNYFRTSPEKMQVAFNDKVLYLDLSKGRGVIEVIKERKIIKEMNHLHLNLPQKIWTVFADFYAFGLLILAISGLFVLKGNNGITRRGAWITVFGVIVPIVFIFIYT